MVAESGKAALWDCTVYWVWSDCHGERVRLVRYGIPPSGEKKQMLTPLILLLLSRNSFQLILYSFLLVLGLKVDPVVLRYSATALCLPQQPTPATSLLSPPGFADGRFRLALRNGPVTSLSHESRDCEALVVDYGIYCLLNAHRTRILAIVPPLSGEST